MRHESCQMLHDLLEFYLAYSYAMRYYAQTAGYSSVPLSPAVQQNPGIQMQLGYPARQFNQACMNTH
jgi:hypothetical protein